MRLKKPFLLSIFLLVLTLLQLPTYAANNIIKIYVNNNELPQGTAMTDPNGIVYVAASEFIKGLGGLFSFQVNSQEGKIAVGSHELIFTLDSSVARLDGKYIQADAPMKIINNRFMIPACYTAGKLGASYYQDGARNAFMVYNPDDSRLVYKVLPGDTLWKISQVFTIPIAALRQNNSITGDMLYIGQKLLIRNLPEYSVSIPAYTTSGATVFSGPGFNYSIPGYLAVGSDITIRGKTGDWFKVDTKVGCGYVYRTVTGIKQTLPPPPKSNFFSSEITIDTSRDTVTYNNYTVVSGDGMWLLSRKFGISDYELAAANQITTATMLYPGQILKIPVHNIAPPVVSLGQYGEVLDWFKQGQYIFPEGKVGRLVDPVSGNGFMIKRTMGSSHSDTEPLTKQDTQIMKQLFGGTWNWTRKAFILEVDGRRLAVSVSGVPHAGVDGVPLNQNVDNRSDNYGYGPNYDSIAGNDMDGHFDLYFLNGLRHLDNKIDPEHQYSILTAGGLR